MKPCMVGGVGLLFGGFEVGETLMLGSKSIHKTLEKVHTIRNQLQTTYSQQKTYADHQRMDLEFGMV